MCSGICTWITSAPQSASWRAEVGPARTCVMSITRKRESAWEAGICGIAMRLPEGSVRDWCGGFTQLKLTPTRIVNRTMFLYEEFARVPHLELEQLTKRYPGVTSVDAISLSVERGEFICLLGPSGCGKTTTLRMIAGFLEPDEGRIRLGGKVVSQPGSVVPPERRNMGMIFQS